MGGLSLRPLDDAEHKERKNKECELADLCQKMDSIAEKCEWNKALCSMRAFAWRDIYKDYLKLANEIESKLGL